MSRIPQHFLDEIGTEDLVAIIGARIALKPAGGEFTALCPFHNEKTPSFTVSPSKGFYHCFGCPAHGNAINFVMEYEGVDFLDAVSIVARELGREVPREPRKTSSTAAAPQQHASLYGHCKGAGMFFAHELGGDGPALSYLARRGVGQAIASEYELGYAPDSWSALKLAATLAKPGASTERDLQTLGLLSKSERQPGRLYDRFRNRIMFPIMDERGRVVGFGGRALGDASPKYLNSPESPIFHKGQILYGLWQAVRRQRRLPRIVVVEGFFDVLAMAEFEAAPAVGTMGTSFTDSQAKLLFKYTNQVYFCFDADRAGRAAAFSAARTVLPHLGGERQVGFVFLPAGEDPDSLLRGAGVEAFHDQLAAAQPLSEFLFAELSQGVQLSSFEGKAQLAERAFPLIDSIPPGAFQELMRRHLVGLTGLDGRPSTH
ncbi:TPA: DNA primase [Stenotrophomonas maltophilia]